MLTSSLLLVLLSASPVEERARALAEAALKNPGDVRSAAPLIRLHALIDEVEDLNLLADPSFTLLYRRRTEPLVRTLVQRLLVDVERARGRTVKARELLDALGTVQHLAVVGSFENEGKSGCDTDWGPEGPGLDLSASYDAPRGRKARWRSIAGTGPDGYVDLSVLLKPDTEAVGYALTFLEAKEELTAQLALGTSGGFRLFVNGVRVAASDRDNRPRPDQHRVDVRLRKGLNRVLLKVCQSSGPYGFYLSAMAPDGPVPSVLPAAVPPLEKGSSPAPAVQPTLASTLERRVKGAPSNAELRGDWATVLGFTAAFEAAERAAEAEAVRAALQEPRSAELALGAALATDDVNERRRWLAAALAVDPHHPFAQLELGRLELRVEHPERALALASSLERAHPTWAAPVLVRVRALEALGERVAAFLATEEAFRAFPLSPQVVRAAAALAPDSPTPAEREGRARLLAGQKDEALAAFRRALAAKAHDPALKELVNSLEGGASGLTDDEAFPLSALDLKLAATGEDAVTLAQVTHVRVAASGQASRFQQLVVKVFTPRGVDAFRTVSTAWSPDREELRVLKARVLKADGSVMEAASEQERPLNEPWTGMYYDARAKVLVFPALAPGDVVEVQWRIDDVASENLLADSWGDVDQVASDTAKKRYRYVVEMPGSRPLHWNRRTLPAAVRSSVVTQGSVTQYRFEATDVPRVVAEPGMPPAAEVVAPLHVSTFGSWAEVGRFYAGLVRDQLVPSAELRRTVESTLKGVDRKDPNAVVRALYGFVVKNTRYVALEFGIHSFKPYPVDRVLARRFGDCKDKASLLVAMLGVAGIEARLVLLRMRHLGALDGEVASLAAFNHAVAYVPSLDLYLDGTAEFHGSHELPVADRLAGVLIVEPDGQSVYRTVPEARPEDNLTTLTMDITLDPGGSARATGALEARGQAAPEIRSTYETVATRTSVFEQQWSQSFPGVTASTVTVSDPTDLESPASVSFTMDIPRYAEAGGGSLRFFPFGASRTFAQVLAPLAERRHDAVYSGVWVNQLHFTYRLPPGWIGPTEDRLSVPSPFGALEVSVSSRGGLVSVDGALTMRTARVAAKDYPAFRAWLVQVDQAFARKLVVRRGPQTAGR